MASGVSHRLSQRGTQLGHGGSGKVCSSVTRPAGGAYGGAGASVPLLSPRSRSAGEMAAAPSRRCSGPSGRVMRRKVGDSAPGGRRLAATVARTVRGLAVTLECSAPVRMTASTSSAARRCFWCTEFIAARAIWACRSRALASSTPCTCFQADARSCATWSSTTRVPKPAAARVRGSRFELVQPAAARRVHASARRVPATVDRRHHHRVGVVRVVGPRVACLVHEVGEPFPEVASARVGPGRVRAVGGAHRTWQPEHLGRIRHAPPHVIRAHVAGAHLRRHRAWLEPRDERLEVSLGGGPEVEAVVDGQHKVGVAGAPGGRRGGGRHRLLETTEAPSLEGGYQEARVVRIRGQAARTYEAREHPLRFVTGDLCDPACARGAEASRHLGMGPRPRVGQVGQVACVVHGDRRQGFPFRRARVLVIGEHHENQPWPHSRRRAAHVLGRRHREQPGEVGVVELHAGEVVGLECLCAVFGIAPDDVAGIDADHVARAVQLDLHIDVVMLGGAAVAGRVHLQLHAQSGAVRQRAGERVLPQNLGQRAAANPREEVVSRDAVHAVAAS